MKNVLTGTTNRFDRVRFYWSENYIMEICNNFRSNLKRITALGQGRPWLQGLLQAIS